MTDDPAVDVLAAADAEPAQARAAGALRASGCGVGDRVAFCLPSSAALLCAVLGALRIGVVPVLLNRTLTTSERDVLLDDADPTVVVTDEDALARLDGGRPVALQPHPLARPIHYTSGTTGRAKGVWTGLWDGPTAAAAFADEADLWSFGPDDVHLVCSPMYHSPSVRFAAGTLLSGGTCVILRRFDPDRAKEALDGRYGPVPTTAFMAPTALGRLLAAPGVGRGTLASLRLLAHAGSACPPELKRAALDAVGPDVLWEFYGSTEGQFTACSGGEWLAHPGTVGRARSGRTLSVVDGVVWCRPPGFCRFTYWRDEARSSSAWKDGAFTVGDLGRLDEDGYLYLEGRRDDLVITGGVNVYPVEVEATLGEVAGVAEVAVFGLADAEWGQRVCAAVVPAPGVDTGRLQADLVAYAADHLAGYKRPKQFAFVEGLPRTGTGKVQRLRLPAVLGLE